MSVERISPSTLTVTHIHDGEEVVTGGPDGQVWVATFADRHLAAWFVNAAKDHFFHIKGECRVCFRRNKQQFDLAAEIKARMDLAKGEFCRGIVNPHECHHCGRLHAEHKHTDEGSFCPTLETGQGQ